MLACFAGKVQRTLLASLLSNETKKVEWRLLSLIIEHRTKRLSGVSRQLNRYANDYNNHDNRRRRQTKRNGMRQVCTQQGVEQNIDSSNLHSLSSFYPHSRTTYNNNHTISPQAYIPKPPPPLVTPPPPPPAKASTHTFFLLLTFFLFPNDIVPPFFNIINFFIQ